MSDAEDLAQVAARFEASLRSLDPMFRIYQCSFKRDGARVSIQTHPEHPLVEHALRDRKLYFDRKSAELYTIDSYFVIIYEGSRYEHRLGDQLRTAMHRPILAFKSFFSSRKTIVLIDEAISRAEQILVNKVNSFIIQSRDAVDLHLVGKDEAFNFYRRLLNFNATKADAVRLCHNQYLDYFVCNSEIECHRDHLRLDEHYVKILTLRDPPPKTYSNMLRSLQELPSQYVIVTEFAPVDNLTMRSLIKRNQRHAFNSKTSLFSHLNLEGGSTAPSDQLIDQSAGARVNELGACLTALEMDGISFGQFSLTVILYDTELTRVEKSAAEAFKCLAVHGATLLEERYNLINAFWASLPGNSRYNLRSLYLPSVCFADLSLLFAPHPGEPIDAHLGAECLATFQTRQKSLFSFSLHQRDLANTLIFGMPGAGKSFLVNFFVTQSQQYEPRIVIFDIGGSYEMITTLFGGSYMSLARNGDRPRINPFSLELTPANWQFLFSFLKLLIELSGVYQMTDQDQRDLFAQIGNLYHIEASQRRLNTLLHILPKHLEPYLRRWTEGGQYGEVFDNDQDTLTFARFQTFDFGGMDACPEIIEPLLFYILHRASAEICDAETVATFKLGIVDEAWRFLKNATVKSYIVEAMKTWRKFNAAMILATQSAGDLSDNGVLQAIVDACATLVFLANPRLDRRQYREVFRLNETELDLIAGLTPKRQLLIKRTDLAKVLELNVSASEYWLYTNTPADNDLKRRAFQQLGIEKGLEFLATQKRAIDNPLSEKSIEETNQ